MPLFAILDTEKGAFLPGGGRGGTWREPDPDKPPRLFSRRAHAETALKWWLGGPGYRSGGGYGEDYSEDDFYQSQSELRVGRQRTARAHLMKVVEVSLVVQP